MFFRRNPLCRRQPIAGRLFVRHWPRVSLGSGRFIAAGPCDQADRGYGKRWRNFKFSLAAYSYRNLLTESRRSSRSTISSSTVPRWGWKGPSSRLTTFRKNATRRVSAAAQEPESRLGLDISGTAVGNDFCHPPGKRREEQIALVKRWVDNAEILGTPVIRIFSGKPKAKGNRRPRAHRLAVAGMEECCDYAGQHGTFLALENHGGLTNEVDDMLAIRSRREEPLVRREHGHGQFP